MKKKDIKMGMKVYIRDTTYQPFTDKQKLKPWTSEETHGTVIGKVVADDPTIQRSTWRIPVRLENGKEKLVPLHKIELDKRNN